MHSEPELGNHAVIPGDLDRNPEQLAGALEKDFVAALGNDLVPGFVRDRKMVDVEVEPEIGLLAGRCANAVEGKKLLFERRELACARRWMTA